MNAEYINPFLEASKTVFKQTANIDVSLGNISLKHPAYIDGGVMIVVGLTGKIRGHVIFSMPKEVALMVASSMMGGMVLAELNDISKSAISELTNMILGNAATILYGNGIGVEITPPSFLNADNPQISGDKSNIICIPLIFSDSVKMEIGISVIDWGIKKHCFNPNGVLGLYTLFFFTFMF